MKKRFGWIRALCLFLWMALCAVPAFAAGASANLVGPGQVETDGSMTVGLHIDGTGITALSGKIEYDPDQLSVQHTEQKLFGTWQINVQASQGAVTFTAEDTQGASAIDTDTEILAVSFLVHNASPGETVDVRAVQIKGIDTDGAFDAPDAIYHKTVASNKNGDATLSSITVSNGTWTPEFSPQTTSYEVTLPAGMERVDVQAVPTDAKAKVSGTGNFGLSEGQSRSVTLTCTAEDGTQKTYTLKLTRASGPNAGMVTASPGITPMASAAPVSEGMQGGTVLLLVLLAVLALGVGGWIAYTVMRKKAEEARREQRLRQRAPRHEPHASAKAPAQPRHTYRERDDDEDDGANGYGRRYSRPQAYRDDVDERDAPRPYGADRAVRGGSRQEPERRHEAQAYTRPQPVRKGAQEDVQPEPDVTDWYDDAWNEADAYAPEGVWEANVQTPVEEPQTRADSTRVYTPRHSAHTTQQPHRIVHEREADAPSPGQPANRRPRRPGERDDD